MLRSRTARRRRGVLNAVAASVWIEYARLVVIERSAAAKLAGNGPTRRHKKTKLVIVARRIKGCFRTRNFANFSAITLKFFVQAPVRISWSVPLVSWPLAARAQGRSIADLIREAMSYYRTEQLEARPLSIRFRSLLGTAS